MLGMRLRHVPVEPGTMRVDLGAMRFPTFHNLVGRIAENLGLELTDFANLNQVTKLFMFTSPPIS